MGRDEREAQRQRVLTGNAMSSQALLSALLVAVLDLHDHLDTAAVEARPSLPPVPPSSPADKARTKRRRRSKKPPTSE